ncbi:hypothetical protein [Spiroplasma monobiae]|uniref:Uncharacterized protein n=1 Tax=Spiroplasma monobiae MQ-1 TaxID=1336748 RepID=A0A2K9LUM1_SPISQ|nr:hypothetical protein [Spiroplasma monobiae]AUM62747.1 hypothetical protein SMONO_v1c04980 [Spiroplasma monobiae MQ-1]
MKKLLTILGTLSISVPVTLSVSAFSINQRQELLNFASGNAWASDDYLQNIVKSGEGFAVWESDYDDKAFEYFIVSSKSTISIYLLDENANLQKHDLITGLQSNYTEVAVVNDVLYFGSYYSPSNSILKSFSLTKESIKETYLYNDPIIESVAGTSLSNGKFDSGFFDATSKMYIMSNNAYANIINLNGTPQTVKSNLQTSNLDAGEKPKKVSTYSGGS